MCAWGMGWSGMAWHGMAPYDRVGQGMVGQGRTGQGRGAYAHKVRVRPQLLVHENRSQQQLLPLRGSPHVLFSFKARVLIVAPPD